METDRQRQYCWMDYPNWNTEDMILLVSLFLERIFPKYLNDEERARLEDKPPENETED